MVHEDGSETRLRNVKRVMLRARGRAEAVTCILELYNPVIDIEMPMDTGGLTILESPDPGEGDFLGEHRRILGL